MILYKSQTIKKMMNRPQMYFKRIIYNSNLNKEKFILNKKKMNERKSIQVRKFCTYNSDPEDPDPDWLLFIWCAITAYAVGKINGKKR